MDVDIWSDIVCPWCYVGKRRFERALAGFAHRADVRIVHRAFQLNPAFPRDKTSPRRQALMSKYGVSEARARDMDAQMVRTAAGEGLEFNLEGGLTGNTFDAHQVVRLAAGHGLQDAVVERLFRAYFTEQRSIFDEPSLVELAAEVGLDPAGTTTALRAHACADDVREDLDLARRIGITGVPFFVIDMTYGISGAQPAEVFAEALRKAC